MNGDLLLYAANLLKPLLCCCLYAVNVLLGCQSNLLIKSALLSDAKSKDTHPVSLLFH
jgi:hypothetical protein